MCHVEDRKGGERHGLLLFSSFEQGAGLRPRAGFASCVPRYRQVLWCSGRLGSVGSLGNTVLAAFKGSRSRLAARSWMDWSGGVGQVPLEMDLQD